MGRGHLRRLVGGAVVGLLVVLVAACQSATSPVTAWNGGQSALVPMPNPVQILSEAATGDGGVWVLADRGVDAGWSVGRLDAAGQWDPAFGTGGWTAPSGNIGSQVFAGPSGSVYVAGFYQGPFGGDFGPGPMEATVTRFDATGALDPTFGSDGVAAITPGVFYTQFAVGADGQMLASANGPITRYSLTGVAEVTLPPVSAQLLASVNGAPLVASGGTLQLLNDDGSAAWTLALPGFGPNRPIEQASVVGSTIVAASLVTLGTTLVARLSVSGVLDRTFNSGGVRTVASPFGAADPGTVGQVAVDSAGRVAVPFFNPNANGRFGVARIVRLGTNGTPDPTFGTAGQIVLDGSSQASPLRFAAASVVPPSPTLETTVVPFGSGIVVATADVGASPDLVFPPVGLTAFDATGQPGPAPTGGTADVPTVGGSSIVGQVVPLPGGGVVAAVYGYDGSTTTACSSVRLVGLTSSGTIDQSFGTGGYSSALCYGDTTIGSLRRLADGSLLLAISGGAAGGSPRVARFTSAGQLDPAFGTDGVASLLPTTPGTVPLPARAIVLPLPSGGFVSYAAWHTSTAVPGSSDLVETGSLQILDESGQPVGSPVAVNAAYEPGGDSLEALGSQIVVDPSGRILLATIDPNSPSDVTIQRYSSSLAPDPSFGSTGVDVVPLPSVVALAVAPSGRILVGSYEGTVAARLPDGGPDTGFGSGGVVLSPALRTIAVDESGRLLSVSQPGNYTTDLPTVRRFTPTGQPDTSFTSSGSVTLTATQLTTASGVTLGASGQILLGGFLRSPGGTAPPDVGAIVALQG